MPAQKLHYYDRNSGRFLQNSEVFVHPSTGEPFTNNASPRLMWNKGLKACGIRHRNSYQTRHTFCTTALQSGAKIHWVSQQLGHASAMMTLNRYSKWIQQANAENESSKRLFIINGGHPHSLN